MKSGTIDLSGRIALVTGGGNGIGATISLVLAQAASDRCRAELTAVIDRDSSQTLQPKEERDAHL